MVVALAQKRKKLESGEEVQSPIELQMGFLLNRWGIEILGPEPDYKLIARASHAQSVYSVFRKDHRHRSPEDWEIVRSALRIIEGWET